MSVSPTFFTSPILSSLSHSLCSQRGFTTTAIGKERNKQQEVAGEEGVVVFRGSG
jgi:hypothetical protein